MDSHICDELQARQNQINKEIKTERDRVTQCSKDYGELKTAKEALKRANDSMAEQLLDLQSRSMRENLLFYGFDECANSADRKSEDCAEKIMTFCVDTLNIMDARSQIKIERAHRVGQYRSDRKRPIVAKFHSYSDKVSVKQRAMEKSRGSNDESLVRVSDQFPKEIQARRKQLIPALAKAKEAGKPAYLSYDKLFIDNRRYTVETVSQSGFSDA
ncbi:uncharacterized protein LOC128550032 [Mercenaria mercenaria]|uniref:uncharacterized protein LOC128550032 n=1 Tax=Mercenaria mercenaria TaxID=6596 RepID=UPI00234F1DFB|nr:uncharacterized protein LOC128550032 [Mercenaria mercenaria]